MGKLTFLKSEIDSVVCSQVDLQGQRHEEYVVQEIWTRDSVYRTLLSTIDSVSFATVVNTCPDAHHPHAVDLGLPSGTKWACCNVGAPFPEAFGGFYAWGETWQKDSYNRYTYAYTEDWIDEVKIGEDIAGTSYDVAHVLMGDAWRMPTVEDQKELMDNCSLQETQRSGMNGVLVTGPNGNQIFLPQLRRGGDPGLLRLLLVEHAQHRLRLQKLLSLLGSRLLVFERQLLLQRLLRAWREQVGGLDQ